MPLPSTFLNYMEEDESVNPKHPENVQKLEENVSNRGLLYNQNDLIYINYYYPPYVILCNS